MPRPDPAWTLLRLDPPPAAGDRPARETPTRFFASRAEALRETRHLNARAREWQTPWRWRFRRTRPADRAELTGF